MMMCSMPEATHSSTTYWICGLSTTLSISLGCALVAGKKRVPSPAAGRTALRTFLIGAGFAFEPVGEVICSGERSSGNFQSDYYCTLRGAKGSVLTRVLA